MPLALEKLADPELKTYAITQDDLVIYFDNMCSDFARLHHDLDCEEFKATVSRYDLLNADENKDLVNQILDTIERVASTLQTQ